MARDPLRTTLGRTAAAATLAFTLALPAAASAEEEDRREVAGGENRELNGHLFITPVLGKSAFNNGSFAFQQGVGAYQFRTPQPQFDAGGTFVGFTEVDHTIFLYYQDLAAQFGFLNYASLDVRATGFAAVAGNGDDIIDIGAFTQIAAGAFARGRILTVRDLGIQLSAGIGADYERTLNLSISDYVAGVNQVINDIANGQLDAATANLDDVLANAELIRTFSSALVTPAVMLAYGTGPFGAQFTLKSDVSIDLDASGVSASISPDLQLEFDVGHYTEYFPVALLFEYALTATVSGGSGTGHSIAAGIQYSGRRDINLGALFVADNVTSTVETFMYGALNIQYFF